MVIHIVNEFPRERPAFLQFIRKSEQLRRPILPGENQVGRRLRGRAVQNSADRLVGNANAEQIRGIWADDSENNNSAKHGANPKCEIRNPKFRARLRDSYGVAAFAFSLCSKAKAGPAWIRTRDQGIMSPLLYR